MLPGGDTPRYLEYVRETIFPQQLKRLGAPATGMAIEQNRSVLLDLGKPAFQFLDRDQFGSLDMFRSVLFGGPHINELALGILLEPIGGLGRGEIVDGGSCDRPTSPTKEKQKGEAERPIR